MEEFELGKNHNVELKEWPIVGIREPSIRGGCLLKVPDKLTARGPDEGCQIKSEINHLYSTDRKKGQQ